MDVIGASHALVAYIRQLDDFEIIPRNEMVYSHVGAALSDAVLQSGINYRTVVWPRIQRILTTYARHHTSLAFHALLVRRGANEVLQWRDEVKPTRLMALTKYCVAHQLVTCADIAAHLSESSNVSRLLEIRGVGPKTIDYLAGLVGIDRVAVDRHVLSFVNLAGIASQDYTFVRNTVTYAAGMLGVSCRSLDHSIWLHESTVANAI